MSQQQKNLSELEKKQQEKGYLEAAQEKAGELYEGAKDKAQYAAAQTSDKANELYYKGQSGVSSGQADYYAAKQDVRAEKQDIKDKSK